MTRVRSKLNNMNWAVKTTRVISAVIYPAEFRVRIFSTVSVRDIFRSDNYLTCYRLITLETRTVGGPSINLYNRIFLDIQHYIHGPVLHSSLLLCK